MRSRVAHQPGSGKTTPRAVNRAERIKIHRTGTYP